ncbi:CRISPR-associated endonuclease Cas1 [Salmonella enterica subsp. enterica]
MYLWLPVEADGGQLARQCVASDTEYVRRQVAHWMIGRRFGRTFHPTHGVNVLRGYEGAEIRKLYSRLAREHGIPWVRRQTKGRWQAQSPVNKTLSLCNAALYGLTEIAILSAGYSPWFGFMHGRSGKALVYDVADMVKFEYITPLAFRFAADGRPDPEWRARAACIRLFRRGNLLRDLIGVTEELMHVATTALADGPPRRRRTSLSRNMARH